MLAHSISIYKDARSVSVEGGVISGNTAGKNGSAIYLDKGIVTFTGGNSAVQLSGEIYKNGGTINIAAATLDLSHVTFRTASVAEGTVLLRQRAMRRSQRLSRKD